MEKVSVNRGLLIGVVAVAGVALLALAFVLGREAGSGVPAPLTKVERVAPRPQEEPLPQPTPSAASAALAERAETRPFSAPAPAAPWAPVVAPPVQAPAQADGERRGAGPDPERASVVAYFDAVDHIQPGAMTGEADGIANQMAAALANGDTSGLDKMIRQTEAAKERLIAIAPPAPCATFHRESLGSLDDGLEVLRSLKTAMESPEPATQLAGVAARANALRSRADVLQKEEQALRQRYGLKP